MVRSPAAAPGPSSSMPGVDEVHRVGPAGRDPRRLGEEVEPGRVEPAAEGEVGVEARPGGLEVGIVEPDDEEDLADVARDQVHARAHPRPP